MSRSNPLKKKRKCANSTLLMFGEGLGEEVFFKHLKRLYARDGGVSVTIKNGKGGSADGIVMSAVRCTGAFDRRVVVLDNDKSRKEMGLARSLAQKNGIELLENTPCLEAILLSILRDGKSFSNKTAPWCKKEFKSGYLDERKKTDIREYEKVFPKELLDQRCIDVDELEQVVSLMRVKND
ncbi:MAG: hypothetical protein U9Q03_00070 [Patescibacteria group bacterium]|nr:hypothetical protein [Patescibacteria group bacterium]